MDVDVLGDEVAIAVCPGSGLRVLLLSRLLRRMLCGCLLNGATYLLGGGALTAGGLGLGGNAHDFAL